jgi:hypothetical protein
MPARDFVNETLLPWLEREIADVAKGNKHYLAGFEDAMKGMVRFIESQRDEGGVISPFRFWLPRRLVASRAKVRNSAEPDYSPGIHVTDGGIGV